MPAVFLGCFGMLVALGAGAALILEIREKKFQIVEYPELLFVLAVLWAGIWLVRFAVHVARGGWLDRLW